jgi:NAD(P)H-nitrite reductase large subunit
MCSTNDSIMRALIKPVMKACTTVRKLGVRILTSEGCGCWIHILTILIQQRKVSELTNKQMCHLPDYFILSEIQVCDSPDQAAYFHNLGPKLRASSLDGLGVKVGRRWLSSGL